MRPTVELRKQPQLAALNLYQTAVLPLVVWHDIDISRGEPVASGFRLGGGLSLRIRSPG